jgi:uncharacterized protein YbjQ (UPF0145 family)
MIVVTSDQIPGLTVRATNLGATFSAGIRSIGGGELPEYTRIMYESRHEVMRRMTEEAQQRGANAIVAMRFDTDAIGQFSEVCAYGTAVIAEPIPAGEPGATGQSAQMAAGA